MTLYQPHGAAALTRPQSSTAHVVIAWVVTALTMLYMLPWAIAATRSHKDTAAIALLNLFLGWSFVGWIAALVWSLGTPYPVQPVVLVGPGYPMSAPTAPAPYPPAPYAIAPPRADFGQPASSPYRHVGDQPVGSPYPTHAAHPPYPVPPASGPSAQPYSAPSAGSYPDPSATRPYPAPPAGGEWQPAPWDRPSGPGSHG